MGGTGCVFEGGDAGLCKVSVAWKGGLTLFCRVVCFEAMIQLVAGFGFWFYGYFYPAGKTAS